MAYVWFDFLYGNPIFNSPQRVHKALQKNELNRGESNPGSFMKGARDKKDQKNLDVRYIFFISPLGVCQSVMIDKTINSC